MMKLNTDNVCIEVIAGAFLRTAEEMMQILGPASGTGSGGFQSAWWDLDSKGRIRLDNIGVGLQLRLLSMRLADVERYEETHDMSYIGDD